MTLPTQLSLPGQVGGSSLNSLNRKRYEFEKMRHKFQEARDILVLLALSNSESSGESAHAQTPQSFRCSHTQSIGVDQGEDQNLDL